MEGFEDCTDGRCSQCSVWLCSFAPLELAYASDLWIAPDHILAGNWPVCAGQDSFWRLPSSPWRSPSLEEAHGRALGADESGGAGEVPHRYAGASRLSICATGRACL